jgi:hypothetical protein
LCGESGDHLGVGDELGVIEDDKRVDSPIAPGGKCARVLPGLADLDRMQLHSQRLGGHFHHFDRLDGCCGIVAPEQKNARSAYRRHNLLE